jgi:hypothetical protein
LITEHRCRPSGSDEDLDPRRWERTGRQLPCVGNRWLPSAGDDGLLRERRWRLPGTGDGSLLHRQLLGRPVAPSRGRWRPPSREAVACGWAGGRWHGLVGNGGGSAGGQQRRRECVVWARGRFCCFKCGHPGMHTVFG